jgi:hypothetical protein
MKWFRKDVSAPSGEKVTLEGVQLWMVRWTSRYGEYHGNVQSEAAAFTTQEDAEHFAQSLRDAFELIRHTSQAYVEVEPQQ